MMEPVLISLVYRRPLGRPSLEVLEHPVVRVPPVKEMSQQLVVGCWLSEVSDGLLFPPPAGARCSPVCRGHAGGRAAGASFGYRVLDQDHPDQGGPHQGEIMCCAG